MTTIPTLREPVRGAGTSSASPPVRTPGPAPAGGKGELPPGAWPSLAGLIRYLHEISIDKFTGSVVLHLQDGLILSAQRRLKPDKIDRL